MLTFMEIELDQLKPWEMNPRLNDQAVDAVVKSIRAFGFNVPILCDQNMTIVAGHTRWKAAKAIGMRTAPVVVLDLTDSQRRAFSIADNKTAEIADWDMPKLHTLLEELRSEDFDLHRLGFSDADLRRILLDDCDTEDDMPDRPKVARTRPGQVYALGAHRLICGNSCDKATWKRLLQNRLVDMAISSPPRFNNLGMGCWSSYERFCCDMGTAIDCLASSMGESSIVFWTSGNSGSISSNFAGLYAKLFESADLEYLDTLAWVRPGANFTSKRVSHIRKDSTYYPARQWETILVYRKPGRMKKMSPEGRQYMLEYQTDMWEIAAVNSRKEKWDHPTVAPVEIPYRALQAYSAGGDVVVDPFAGSGTTLMAVEKAGAGRTAFLIEISPLFCDVIVQRWQNYTGKEARLLDGADEER